MDEPAALASTIAPAARSADPARELAERFPQARLAPQETKDEVPTLWVDAAQVHDVLAHLKRETDKPYRMLYDLTAVDERAREHREGMPDSDFTVVYHLLSYERNADVRLKVALKGDGPALGTITDLWPAASWYEREVWDLFGIRFDGHPHLRRLLLPPTWKGHPLRKDHPARATEMGPFEMPDDKWLLEEEALTFRPEDWNLERSSEDGEFLFLNIGPQHPGTHGVLRLVLQLDGEVIRDCIPDIGFHHRGAEKMGERQTWHTYIPYTDRIDYLSGVQNNLAYLLAVEKLAGIEVPERALVIRILVCELYRLASHLVWYGTFAQDIGALSPVFFMFTDRERIFEICEAITGGRMHPSWFRIGGVAADLPEGWEDAVRKLVKYLRRRIREYDGMVLKNSIFKRRNVGVGAYSLDEAIDWGVTGPGLRACGLEWDFRKKRPYGGYDRFDFDVPTATGGDGYARALVRVEEMRQSLRILEQCVERMPSGPVKSDHPLTTPPNKDRTMHDIETLIHHFLSVSWGPVIPPGEAHAAIEAPKGYYGYWLTSDGGIHSYRTRIRAPSFPHMQMVPLVSKGMLIADLLAYLGSIDFVLADIDR